MAKVWWYCDPYDIRWIILPFTWANWRLQAKKDMESNTDPIDSIQLNINPICIFEYGKQWYNNSTCCGKSVVYIMWSLWQKLDNFACWVNWIIQAKKDMESHTDPIDSIQLNIKPICIFEYGNQLYNNSTCCGKSVVYMLWSL